MTPPPWPLHDPFALPALIALLALAIGALPALLASARRRGVAAVAWIRARVFPRVFPRA